MSDKNANWARGIAVVIAVTNVLLCIPLYLSFDPGRYDMQFLEDHLWIRAYQIHYALGVDGISLVMVILTNFTGLLVVIAGCHSIKAACVAIHGGILTMQGMIVGVFCCHGCYFVLCFLGRHVHSHVFIYWHVGKR